MACALVLCLTACTPQACQPPESPPPPQFVNVTDEQVVGTWNMRYSSAGTLVFKDDHSVTMIDVTSAAFNGLQRRRVPLSGEGTWRITHPPGGDTQLRDTVELRFAELSDNKGPRDDWMRAIKQGDTVILSWTGYAFVKA